MLKRSLQSLAAVVGGYLLMVLLITLVQEVWLGGSITWNESGWTTLVLGGAGTFLSAVAGGAFAARVAPARPFAHVAVQCLLVSVETVTLMVTGVLTDPLWFDVLAASSLVAGLLLGAALVRSRTPCGGSPHESAAATH